MAALTLVLPFALPPPAHARDLIARLRLPALAMALARGTLTAPPVGDSYSASLPHEQWLSGQANDNSPPIAHPLMHALGLPEVSGHWFVLQPVHLHIARDHLVLTDHRQLALDDATSRTLFDAARPLFTELGLELVYGNAQYWFVRADAWAALRTCTPDVACGHNIDVWLPTGSAAREWRRLHNEVQMLWHQHPVNEARDAQGQHRVNALWLWGGAAAPVQQEGLALLAGSLAGRHGNPPSDALPTRLIDTLLPLSLADDWSGWLQEMHRIDEAHIAPVLAGLRNGTLTALNLVLSNDQRLLVSSLRRASMRKFWRPPSLSCLAP